MEGWLFEYNLDAQTFHKQIDGILGSLGILVLIFFIPIVTLINYFIVEIVRKKVYLKE